MSRILPSPAYGYIFTVLFVLGIVNRGDSFRRRRSRSNSLCPLTMTATNCIITDGTEHIPTINISKYVIALIGSPGVGKTALISQFMTSECINAYDRQKGELLHNNYNIFILI